MHLVDAMKKAGVFRMPIPSTLEALNLTAETTTGDGYLHAKLGSIAARGVKGAPRC
jgi:hypothetical protein